MPTPEVTGSAALQSEEIKKIAREYVKEILSKQPVRSHAIPEIWAKAVADTERALSELYEPLIAHISKDYCIVPKSKLKEIYDCYKQHGQVTDKKGLHDAMLIARGSIATMHDIFGKELFNEEKE